jgi:Fur family ferric uptake transcriptional regulator
MSPCQTIISDLRQRGYRITPQREIVIDILAHSEHHLSSEEIFVKLQEHSQVTNISTVYRTLEMLWAEGFACRTDLSEGKIVYAAHHHGDHIHLVCRRCGVVMDADPKFTDPLLDQLRNDHQFEADLKHFSIFGVCQDCQG